MKENKKSMITMIIFIICAVIWNIIWLEEFIYGDTNSKSFLVHIVCAIIWDFNAIVWIIRYLKQRKTTDKI